MTTSGRLQIGDRVRLSGGYSFEPAWLAGKEYVDGSVAEFIPGQNNISAAVVKLDEPITYQKITGEIVVLELRYVGAIWSPSETVHVELCDFLPEPAPWKDRRRGKWAESHANYSQLVA